ncbi:hypothetical protein PAMP_023018 [Pampus punctatissimus]
MFNVLQQKLTFLLFNNLSSQPPPVFVSIPVCPAEMVYTLLPVHKHTHTHTHRSVVIHFVLTHSRSVWLQSSEGAGGPLRDLTSLFSVFSLSSPLEQRKHLPALRRWKNLDRLEHLLICT